MKNALKTTAIALVMAAAFAVPAKAAITQQTTTVMTAPSATTETTTTVDRTRTIDHKVMEGNTVIPEEDIKFTRNGNNYIQRSANNWTDEGWTNDLDTKKVVTTETVHTNYNVVEQTRYNQ